VDGTTFSPVTPLSLEDGELSVDLSGYVERSGQRNVGDSAFRQAFQWLYGAPITNKGVREAICSLWHPYSSTAVKFLYRALNCGLTNRTTAKELFMHSSESELA
jgi:hypothetical protein